MGIAIIKLALILSFNLVYSMSVPMGKQLSNSKSCTTNNNQADYPALSLKRPCSRCLHHQHIPPGGGGERDGVCSSVRWLQGEPLIMGEAVNGILALYQMLFMTTYCQ